MDQIASGWSCQRKAWYMAHLPFLGVFTSQSWVLKTSSVSLFEMQNCGPTWQIKLKSALEQDPKVVLHIKGSESLL